MEIVNLTSALLHRLPRYYRYLCKLHQSGAEYISSSDIALALKQNAVQVRKDFAMLSSVPGKSRKGFSVEQLLHDIEQLLGYDNNTDAVLVGVGNLGTALLHHNGFSQTGLDIVIAFDIRKSVYGKKVNGKEIFPITKMENLVRRLNIHLAILAVPAEAAQEVTDTLVRAGVTGILNLTASHIQVPTQVVVQDYDIAMNLAVLSQKIKTV